LTYHHIHLHFDEELLSDLAAREVTVAGLVLHVGPGTFRPLPEDVDLETVHLDEEHYSLPAATAGAILAARRVGGRIVAVGTTVVRALESWAAAGSSPDGIQGETDLFVFPPFRFDVVDVLLTNFHLPRSSLLLLVCAFAGRDLIIEAYERAVKERFRFYSYGDAMLIL